jgi:ABC-type phosphate transport system auxiliary subunit
LSRFDFNNLKDLQKAVIQVINKRLRIKEIRNNLNSDLKSQSNQSY